MTLHPSPLTPPLVFLHGWGLHGGIWADVVQRLGDRPCLTPDLPGYGAVPPVYPYTAEALADALAAGMNPCRPSGHRLQIDDGVVGRPSGRQVGLKPDLRRSGIQRPPESPYPSPPEGEIGSYGRSGGNLEPPACSLIGWSLGGMVALAWAARHPQQVAALVLVGSTPVFVNQADWALGIEPEVLEGFARELAGDFRATLLRFLALQARGGEAAREVIARLRKTVFARGEPDPTVLAAGLELLRSVDLRALAGQVRCPTLVVHGGRDTLCPVAAGRWLAGRLPQARLAVHARAAHAPFLSHPEWFAATLADFLSQVYG